MSQAEEEQYDPAGEELCEHCHNEDSVDVQKVDCFRHCHAVPSGEHEPDPVTISIDPDVLKDLLSSTLDYLIFDINCLNCGVSGSFSVEINPNDIQWE